MAFASSSSQELSSLEPDMSHATFRVRVPASTSNCGPGFDTLGLAFNLYNEVALRRTEDGKIRCSDAEVRFGRLEEAMTAEVSSAFFARTGLDPFGFSFNIRGDVPVARGLGSSVTMRAGILGGLNAAAGSPLDKREIASIVSDLEGHPDNAVAAVFGGFCVVRSDPATGGFVDLVRFEVPASLAFVVLSPELEIETTSSRQNLPEQIAFPDVIKSLNSLAFIVSVFATGEYEKLRGAVTDFVHQPYRLHRVPGGEAAIKAGVEAGAYTGWLSGSGSSFLCVCEADKAGAVAAAMGSVLGDLKIGFGKNLLRCDNRGLQVDEEDPGKG